MIDADSIATTEVSGPCTWCDGPLPPNHHVHVARDSVLLLCSEECLAAELRDDAAHRSAVRRRTLRWVLVVTAIVIAWVTPHDGPLWPRAHPLVAHARSIEPPALPGAYGPEWPPSEDSLIAELGHDAWLHPLAGPFRRMPERDSRVFGAERPGDRPIDCRKGHCGVDLGGEIWGEYVHAAHDGVVDRVRRDPNEQHGGHYVRIAHRNGTVFSQYFHLAAIPRWVQVGVHVKAGDVIGLLGDTGVKESTAHLHFTISVRPATTLPEQYVDPEPLVALWPILIPVADVPVQLVETEGRPGVPLGGAPVGSKKHELSALMGHKKKSRPAKEDKIARKHAPAADAPDAEPTELPSPPKGDEPESESSE